MTDAFDTRAREIASTPSDRLHHFLDELQRPGARCQIGTPNALGSEDVSSFNAAELHAAISSALREAVEAERRTIMNCLGYDERGDDIERTVEQDGVWIKVSSEAYLNLEGALDDLKRQNADRVCISTIERVQRQIGAALDHVRASAIRGESK